MNCGFFNHQSEIRNLKLPVPLLQEGDLLVFEWRFLIDSKQLLCITRSTWLRVNFVGSSRAKVPCCNNTYLSNDIVKISFS